MYWRIRITTTDHHQYPLRVIARVRKEPRHEANVSAFLACYR